MKNSYGKIEIDSIQGDLLLNNYSYLSYEGNIILEDYIITAITENRTNLLFFNLNFTLNRSYEG